MLLGVAAPSLILATLVVAVLRANADVPNASIVYLAAVVATAIAAGAPGAVMATLASILLYDWFFTVPYYTLTISEPAEWLNAVLLLGVGLVVGQLAAMQRSRADDARARESEARMRGITDSAQDAILVMDTQGKIALAAKPKGCESLARNMGGSISK